MECCKHLVVSRLGTVICRDDLRQEVVAHLCQAQSQALLPVLQSPVVCYIAQQAGQPFGKRPQLGS